MKRIMNHPIKFVCQILGKKDSTDGSSWIQKQILKNKYYEKKQNISYGNQLVIDYFPIRTSLTKNDNINVISPKQKIFR